MQNRYNLPVRALADTIVACITAVPGPVAIVRLSGADAFGIARRLFPLPDPPESHRAVWGRLSTGDDGLALPFADRHGYTGEPAVEFMIHGAAPCVRALVEAALTQGARQAEPGEFTQRAFLNGRLDLTQAEAVRDTVEAWSDVQLRQAHLLRSGVLRRQVAALRENLAGVLAAVEATVDFGEEVGPLDRPTADRRLDEAQKALTTLIVSAESGRKLRQGLRVAILGKPNAGKSSLLNALLRDDRAIVTARPGTTRDTLEEAAEILGHPVLLIDTAGLREAEEEAERLGVERARRASESADLRLYVVDAAAGWTPEDEAEFASLRAPKTVVANKSDLSTTPIPGEAIATSALTGDGMDDLRAEIAGHFQAGSGLPLIQIRHVPDLNDALEAVSLARETLAGPVPEDLAAVDLRTALHALGRITGESADDDLLERIFRDFCIGK